MSIDTIGDFLTIIRNGVSASKRYVHAPYSKLKHQVAQLLESEGFIKSVSEVENDEGKLVKIELKYVDGESVIHEISRISKPGRRVYSGFTQLKPVIGNLGVSILTTPKGIMTSKQAKHQSVGGEIICTVW